ncbi:MAG: hypothetical protein NT147_03765 [Candidatus Aminicenantes bacterium]|nr:hypothetical protein [Candidatus Aminicenantes bacterium]
MTSPILASRSVDKPTTSGLAVGSLAAKTGSKSPKNKISRMEWFNCWRLFLN